MTLAVTFPGSDSLMKIYGTFLTGHLARFKEDIQVCACPLGCGTRGVAALCWVAVLHLGCWVRACVALCGQGKGGC